MKKNNGLVIGLSITIVIILGILIFLFSTNTIVFNTKKVDVKDNLQDDKEENQPNDEKKLLTEKEAISIADAKVPVAFDYIYALSSYCGEGVEWGKGSDYIAGEMGDWYHEYDVSKQFKSKDELDTYLQTILSDDLISKFNSANNLRDDLKDKAYLEKDNKLYCLNSNKGCGKTYDKDATTFTVNEITTDKISITASIGYKTCGEEPAMNASIELSKNNSGNWIITSYSDEFHK